MKKIVLTLVILSVFVLTSCSSKEKESSEPKVLSVKSGGSIQEVVNAAMPGDLVLIEPGTYEGDVVVTTEDITIRGLDRNKVVIDGNYKQDNGLLVAANGVRIENLTVQKFRTNGILFQGGYETQDSKEQPSQILERYSATFINALNNGLYGIYAFSAKDGTIAETYTAANADAGIYIGQCKPCNASVFKNVAENNGRGFQAANASEAIYIFGNNFSKNRAGIHILSDTKEKKAPQGDVIIRSNITSENNAASAPSDTEQLFGIGILIAGGNDNLIENNLSKGNVIAGIALAENNTFLPEGNIFRGNLSRENGAPFGFDLAYIISGRPDVMSMGNCFENNSYSSSSVDKIQQVLPCSGAAPGPFKSQPFKKYNVPPVADYKTIPVSVLDKENYPGELEVIPAKLKTIKKPDLSGFGVPSES